VPALVKGNARRARGPPPAGDVGATPRPIRGWVPWRGRAPCHTSCQHRLNIGGRVTALAVDPNNSTHFWLRSASGGVFVSTNAGTIWKNLGLSEVRRIGRIAVDPASPPRVFVTAGGRGGLIHCPRQERLWHDIVGNRQPGGHEALARLSVRPSEGAWRF
jgi:hypothetical protein